MLPKVATNLLHSTVTRGAAAAVQNQANLRNVLQLRPDNTSASSSGSAPGTGLVAASSSSSSISANGAKANAHGGSHGPGSQGGTKNKPGSRFYTGYNSAARAVTQANALTSQDGPAPVEEEDMHPAARRAMLKKSVTPAKRTRLRSSSVNSLLPRDKGKKKGDALPVSEKPSVLKVVQLQARSLHAFNAAQQQSQAPAQAEQETVEDLTVPPPTPAVALEQAEVTEEAPARVQSRSASPVPSSPRPRRNSTSSPVSVLSSPIIHPAELPLPASPQLPVRHSSTSASAPHHETPVRSETPESPSAGSSSSFVSEPESVATTAPSETQSFRVWKQCETAHGLRIRAAIDGGDAEGVHQETQALIDISPEASPQPNIADYNSALEGLARLRQPFAPLHLPLELYNTMLSRSIRPDHRTYTLLIELFCVRDTEVHQLLQSLDTLPPKNREGFGAIKEENNFPSAMRLFEAVVSVGGNSRLYFTIYKRLLASASIHGNVNAALHVLSYLEQRDQLPDPDVYRLLMVAFKNSGDYKGAELVFNKYRGKEEKGELYASPNLKVQKTECWGEMIDIYFLKGEPEKAIEILETMLKAAEEDNGSTIPPPVSKTYTAIINGFVTTGDIPTALSWFKRLLQQTDAPAEDADAALPKGRPTRPNRPAWEIMLTALVKEEQVDELNSLFKALIDDKQTVKQLFWANAGRTQGVALIELHESVLDANLKSVQTAAKDVALQRLQFVTENLMKPGRPWDHFQHRAAFGVCEAYTVLGEYGVAVNLAEKLVFGQLEVMDQDKSLAQFDAIGVTQSLQNFVLGVIERICRRAAGTHTAWTFATAMDLARLASERLGLRIPPAQAGWLLHNYSKDRQAGLVDVAALPIDAWRILLSSALYLEREPLPADVVPEYAFQGLPSFLEDMAAANVPFTDELCDFHARMTIVEHVSLGRDVDWSREYFGKLGPAYLATYEEVVAVRYNQLKEKLDAASPSPIDRIDMVSPPPTARIYRNSLTTSAPVSSQIDNLLRNYQLGITDRAGQAYTLFQEALEKKGQVPNIPTLGRLIQACGRLNQLDRVQEIYGVAQAYLASAKGKIYESKRGVWWVQIEDNMIVALAQAGDIEAAHVHRLRILEFSRTAGRPFNPSPDAYGALILNVKDTTDDATNALMLWNEALQVGVHPNLYLYNNIISKLARARKADQALELFKQMRECGVRPSSITYGAMIGACARVGDTVSAEALFQEMSEQKTFKPRIPPFNTMMQMYTATKPNRERALWFYEEMVRQGVKPTVHTYKLLLDIYGSIEPVDIGAMESVWQQLTTDSSVQINGSHFASLINAYGCVCKDVDRAIAAFDSIPTYGVPRDAVAYEALINALVANKRTELIRSFMERMVEDNVHMTAYVANFLIKGHANSGDVEQARMIFESMLDPPTGVAAPNNHAPHEPATAPAVGVMEPVYREPSTWEAMIRAELGVGDRDRAQSLLDRLRSRQYPEAVFNRISGVMVDHSIPPLP